MALSFRARLTIAMGCLVAATIGVMTLLGVYAIASGLFQFYRQSGENITRLTHSHISHALKLPEMARRQVTEQMVVQAFITAELVAIAENGAGLGPDEISSRLRNVIARSEEYHGSPLIEEFWIAGQDGYAYIHTEDAQFQFRASQDDDDQAADFLPLLEGAPPIVQHVRERQLDGQRYIYVGVAGVDKPRIVQVGMSEKQLDSLLADFRIDTILQSFYDTMDLERIVVLDGQNEIIAGVGAPLTPQDDEYYSDIMAFFEEFRRQPEREYQVAPFGRDLAVLTHVAQPGGEAPYALLLQFHTTTGVQLIRENVMHLLWSGGVMLLIAIVVSLLLSRGISKPVAVLVDGAHEFGKGNLDHRIEIERRDEMKTLGDAFNEMAGSIQIHMRQLEAETANRERMESELRIAAQLQESLLPEEPPPVNGLDIVAWRQPAREVGGDFYDFINFDDHRLGVAIGDASGKGLSAALLSSDCWSMLETVAEDTQDPAEALSRINNVMRRRICDSCRFVTMFLMLVDNENQVIRYSMAGHDPPILLGSDSGRQYSLGSSIGLPLGVQSNAQYVNHEVSLEANDTIILYSDGLTDAHNAAEQMYGEQRLLQLLAEHRAAPLQEMFGALRSDVERHIGKLSLWDDLTALGLRFTGDTSTVHTNSHGPSPG